MPHFQRAEVVEHGDTLAPVNFDALLWKSTITGRQIVDIADGAVAQLDDDAQRNRRARVSEDFNWLSVSQKLQVVDEVTDLANDPPAAFFSLNPTLLRYLS